MVCILAPSPVQSLSRSSSLKGVTGPRGPPGSNPLLFEHPWNPRHATGNHREASISSEQYPAEPYEERLAEALKEIYSCTFSESSFDIYSPDVVFRIHPGAASTKGVGQVRTHFDELHKRYPLANTLCFHVSSSATNSILINLEIEYFRDVNAFVPAKTYRGCITLELDVSQHYVVRHTEEWDAKVDLNPADGVSFANQVPRRMSVTQRSADTYP